MAWPFGGVWTGRKVQDLTYIMAACCRAVNERRELIGQSTVDWYYGDGTVKKAYPEEPEFDGFPINDPNVASGESPAMKFNMEQLNSQCEYLIESTPLGLIFTTTSGGDTAWTVASMESDIGLGAFPDNATRAQLATDWNRVKECLDRLIYLRISLGAAGSVEDNGSNRGSATDTVLEDAWDDAVADLGNTGTGGAMAKWELNFANPFYTWNLQQWGESTYKTTDWAGTVIDGNLVIGTRDEDSYGGDFDIGGDTISVVAPTPPALFGFQDKAIAWDIGINEDIRVEVADTPPANAPFTNDAFFQCVIFEAIMYLDITSELTDQ